MSVLDRYRRTNLFGFLLVITGLLLGAVVLGLDDRWALKIAGFALVATAIALVIVRRPGGLGDRGWSIVLWFDHESRSTEPGSIASSGRRLTVFTGAIVGVGFVVSHVWMSGNWMAQAGLSIHAIGGGR